MTFLLCENGDSWLEHSIYTRNDRFQTEILCFWAVMASQLLGGFPYEPIHSCRICCDIVLLKTNNYINIMLFYNTDSNSKILSLSWVVALITKVSSVFSVIFTILTNPKILYSLCCCSRDHLQIIDTFDTKPIFLLYLQGEKQMSLIIVNWKRNVNGFTLFGSWYFYGHSWKTFWSM